MQRFASMKVGWLSLISCLALLVAMFATTGTAQAYTASSAKTNVDPHIRVVFLTRQTATCTSFLLLGNGFSHDNAARLSAGSLNGFGMFVSPRFVHTDRNGHFSVIATACSNTNFQSCGFFINNPFSFCGFGLSPNDFCTANVGESNFCSNTFNGAFDRDRFTPISVSEFCAFHSTGFCFFRNSHVVFISALDLHTGVRSNTVGIRIRFGFFR
jgi:hypothetical protein